MTFDDPKMYTKPFTIKYSFDLLPNSDVFETVCTENEKDLAHMRQKQAARQSCSAVPVD